MDIDNVVSPRKWLALLKRKWLQESQWPTSNDPTSAFLQLPLDAICLIFDELPLYTKVFLSQTCRPLRSLLRDDCARAVKSLSPKDYFDFISGIANVLPNYVTCLPCGTVHAVNTKDVPYIRCVKSCYPCRDWSQLRCHNFGIRYQLSYQHVQLALKYSRRQPSSSSLSSLLSLVSLRNVSGKYPDPNVYDSYLSRLLWPFTSHALWYNRVAIDFIAQPRVIDGRFILHSRWEFTIRAGLETVLVTLEDIRPSVLCPHLNLTRTHYPRVRSNPMITTAVYAFSNRGNHTSYLGSCTRCATDYSIAAKPTGVTIEAWQDLGNSGSPWDPYWVAQMWNTDNTEYWGPTVQHEPQSIMRNWKRSGTDIYGWSAETLKLCCSKSD
jgi:hypothetical protein